MRICELREKEVVNVCDGERLGNICDIDFEERTGRICTLVIPGPCKIFGIIGRDSEYLIPYECVKRIGADVVLVEIEATKCLHKCEW
ncbi:MAG: YlmC/YmxH family sporulation protein [Clostridium sp.]|uniref:YlmC/YmxH family sporulation protein n=1 Tax=Butyribacter sp. TaxID=2822465 RepID=UPI002A978AD6|nr:YlmC/YmxH family sporulation protein [Clostridium sp.]MDY5181778.1 YlmC/YmxH family sporulation protein [Butyribacter sp.]